MLKFNNNFTNYYLKETEKLVWFKKPKVVIKKMKTIITLGFLMGSLIFMKIVLVII